MTIIILGAGESGTGAALLAQKQGFRHILVSDKGQIADKYKGILNAQGIDFEEGTHQKVLFMLEKHTPSNLSIRTQLVHLQQKTTLEQGFYVIKSPGIAQETPIVQATQAKNIPIISEIEFASYFTHQNIIAITGSNGKTTTTGLTYHLLQTAGIKVAMGGNIGDSFAKQVCQDLHPDVWVLEVSSFQLDNCYLFCPKISVILNITPDHLDRYQYDFQQYVEAKFRITLSQTATDYFIYYQGNEANFKRINNPHFAPIQAYKLPLSTSQDSPQFQATNAPLYIDFSTEQVRIQLPTLSQPYYIDLQKVSLVGKHNALNIACAAAAALLVGAEGQSIAEGLQSFRNVAHRLELVATIDEVQYINDSKATNVDSVFYALDSIRTAYRNIIWIAGGIDKGNDYNQIAQLVQQKVKVLIALGKDNAPLKAFFEDKVPELLHTDSLDICLQIAQQKAQPQDVVLLSPACASFDLFKNYEDRGDQFKAKVQNLVTQQK